MLLLVLNPDRADLVYRYCEWAGTNVLFAKDHFSHNCIGCGWGVPDFEPVSKQRWFR